MSSERKRAVYLSELDWGIVTSCLLDKISHDSGLISREYLTIWKSGVHRVQHIVSEINAGKQSPASARGESK